MRVAIPTPSFPLSLSPRLLLLLLLPLAALAQQRGVRFGPSGLASGADLITLPGCLDASACLFPVRGARFVAGQRFDAYVELHGAAALGAAASPPLLELAPPTPSPSSSPPAYAPLAGSAALPWPETKSWNLRYSSPDLALFNATPGSAAFAALPPNCAGALLALASCTQPAAGFWLRNLSLGPAGGAGDYSVRLSVPSDASPGAPPPRLATWTVVAPPSARAATNVVLFVGDGNNMPFISASRLVSRGQTQGFANGRLNMQTLDRMALLTTNGYDSVMTDSANSASAYATGHKSCVNALGVYCDGDALATDAALQDDFNDPRVELITERIRRELPGMAVGIVTTAELQDATPAAFLSHTRKRWDKREITAQVWEGLAAGGPKAGGAGGGGGSSSTGVASNFGPVLPDILFGGGGQFFNGTAAQCLSAACLPSAACCFPGRNLWAEAASASGGNFAATVLDGASLRAQAAAAPSARTLGVWAAGNENVWLDRHVFTANVNNPALWPVSYAPADAALRRAPTDQPDLAEQTRVALAALSLRGGAAGFFAMVEGGSIDKQEHQMDFDRAMAEQIDFDNAIGAAIDFSKTPAGAGTLILVVSDHGHGYDAWGAVDTLAFNSPNSGAPGCGADFADAAAYEAAEAKKVGSVGIYEAAGWPTYVDANGDGFPDSWSPRVTLAQGKADGLSFYREDFQVSGVPRSPDMNDAARTTSLTSDLCGLRLQGQLPPVRGAQTVHTAADVPLFASGPGSEVLRASMDNTDVFFIMASALGLGRSSIVPAGGSGGGGGGGASTNGNGGGGKAGASASASGLVTFAAVVGAFGAVLSVYLIVWRRGKAAPLPLTATARPGAEAFETGGAVAVELPAEPEDGLSLVPPSAASRSQRVSRLAVTPTPAALLARLQVSALSSASLLALLALQLLLLAPAARAQPGGSGLTGAGLWYDLPGCIPAPFSLGAVFCVFPTTMAQFVVGQRFELGVEVHVADSAGAAAAPYPSSPSVQLLYYPSGGGAAVDVVASGLFSVSGAPLASEAPGFPKEGVFSIYSSVDDATGADALPHPAARHAYRHKWSGLRIPVAGALNIALVVNGIEQARVQWRSAAAPLAGRLAKNVILCIGDGMPSAFVSAARLVSRGIDKVNGNLLSKTNMQSMSRVGFLSTSGYDSVITDSANSASAYATGHKSCNGALGVYCDCDSGPFVPRPYAPVTGGPASTLDDPRVELLPEMLARKLGRGFGLGVVTTAEIQDATPAAFFAHTRSRGDKADITRQLLEGFEPAATPAAQRLSGPAPLFTVALGGGSQYFFPRRLYNVTAGNATTVVSNGFSSLAGRNFGAEFQAAGYNPTAFSARDLALASASWPGPLLGLFHFGNMNVWVDRHQLPQNIAAGSDPRFFDSANFAALRQPPLDQPDLAAMMAVALARLAAGAGTSAPGAANAGFFLMLEGASIDKMNHPQDAERALGEFIDFDNAVGLALDFARARGDTLVLVTADHGHGFDVYGTVDEQLFDAMDAQTADPGAKQSFRATQAILEYDGAGFPTYTPDTNHFPTNWGSAATNRYGLAFGYADVTDQKDDGHAHAAPRSPDIGHTSPTAGIFGPDQAPGGNNHGLSVPRNFPTTASPVTFAGMQEASAVGVHTMQDVPLWAEGPGSELVRVSMENVDLFRIVATALGAGD